MMEINEEAERYFDLGVECYKNKKFEEAINNFTKAIELDRDDKNIYISRGFAYMNIEKYEEAIEDLTKAIELGENDKFIYASCGFAYMEIEKYKEAIGYFTKVLEYEDDKIIYRNRGLAYICTDKYKEAIEDFTKTIKLNKSENYEQKNENTNINNNILDKIKLTDNILDLIYDILKSNALNYLSDDESINLIRLICFCYELMQEIKIKSSEIKNLQFVHYTRASTLQFLLKKDYTAKLRLNNAVYMNDPEEGQILKQIFHKLDENNELGNLLEDNDDIKNYTYLTCFSPDDKKDELPMWVHYGDNTKGVGLVFNKDFFDGIYLYKVQYIDIKNFDISKLNKNVSDNIKAIFDFLKKDEIKNNNNREFKTYVNIILNYISYLFKDDAYEYENEVRILNYRDYNSSDIKTVISESGIPKLFIDYNKCISNKNCVEVIAGPKANYTEISAYSKYTGISKVSKSEIKYR